MKIKINRELSNFIKSSIILFNVCISNILVLLRNVKNTNKNKLKLLMFSDSRGTEISPFYKQKNIIYSYMSKRFFEQFELDCNLCPRKFTSILDFLDSVDNHKYDIVILHCGIVDFSPRPISSYNEMLNSKMDIIRKNNWESYFFNRQDYYSIYNGEPTMSFFSKSFLEEEIIPRLRKINGIIYVGSNPVLLDWKGNYWRERPSCINELLTLDNTMHEKLDCTIDLSNWSRNEIMKYTVDNVHYNEAGLNYIYNALKKAIIDKIRLINGEI